MTRQLGTTRKEPVGTARKSRGASRVELADVVVIGAGQAGLALSHELAQADVEHVVLDRGRVAQTWRTRWDSFCLVIPNWTVRLPGGRYDGGDPDGFMSRDEIVRHLADYALSLRAPVGEGINVAWVGPSEDGGFLLRTAAGNIRARQVVLASGAYQKPYRPPGPCPWPESLHVIDAEDYANPEALPPGKVLVVGSGQTGCQIAEELAESGRDVVLACGRAPWIPRRIEDRDTIEHDHRWLAFHGRAVPAKAQIGDPAGRRRGCGRAGGDDHSRQALTSAAPSVAAIARVTEISGQHPMRRRCHGAYNSSMGHPLTAGERWGNARPLPLSHADAAALIAAPRPWRRQ